TRLDSLREKIRQEKEGGTSTPVETYIRPDTDATCQVSIAPDPVEADTVDVMTFEAKSQTDRDGMEAHSGVQTEAVVDTRLGEWESERTGLLERLSVAQDLLDKARQTQGGEGEREREVEGVELSSGAPSPSASPLPLMSPSISMSHSHTVSGTLDTMGHRVETVSVGVSPIAEVVAAADSTPYTPPVDTVDAGVQWESLCPSTPGVSVPGSPSMGTPSASGSPSVSQAGSPSPVCAPVPTSVCTHTQTDPLDQPFSMPVVQPMVRRPMRDKAIQYSIPTPPLEDAMPRVAVPTFRARGMQSMPVLPIPSMDFGTIMSSRGGCNTQDTASSARKGGGGGYSGGGLALAADFEAHITNVVHKFHERSPSPSLSPRSHDPYGQEPGVTTRVAIDVTPQTVTRSFDPALIEGLDHLPQMIATRDECLQVGGCWVCMWYSV
ncbi:hypothetical protein KIPB_012680, partial [Kipferlia bialata]